MLRSMFIVATIATSAILTGAPAQDTANAATLSCEVKQAKRNGGTVAEGFVTAPAGTAGSYRISVSSAAGDTDQSGEFSGNGSRASLGIVPVAGTGNFTAEITIKIGGVPRCANRITGKI